ncbi:MAG: NeuD/PglB/VioB family sugar acetyltransferase [Candidatus Omnitrophota bacterium]
MIKKLIIFPFGGNAREALGAILDINKQKKEWDVLGFLDDDPGHWGKDLCGVKVLGGREIIQKYPDAKILAVPGNPNNYLRRKEIIDNLGIEKSRFASIVHPTVIVFPDAKIGYNTLLITNIYVGSRASIGNNCIVLPNTTVAHDSVIEDYCCVGSNVVISGYVTIHKNCYISSGTSIRNNITVGEKSLVGLGSNVVADVEPQVVVAGNPAKIIKKVGP